MFDFAWSHILLVLVVALVVVGPKDLPRLMRIVGRWVGKARRMADGLRASFDEMARETELDELRKELAALRNYHPAVQLQNEINRSIQPPAGGIPETVLMGEVAAPPARGEPAPESQAEPRPPGPGTSGP